MIGPVRVFRFLSLEVANQLVCNVVRCFKTVHDIFRRPLRSDITVLASFQQELRLPSPDGATNQLNRKIWMYLSYVSSLTSEQ